MDKITDAWNNQRKIGVEITEANMGKNSIHELVPTDEWAKVADEEREDIWLGTLELPDREGKLINWYIAPSIKVLPHYFKKTAGFYHL